MQRVSQHLDNNDERSELYNAVDDGHRARNGEIRGMVVTVEENNAANDTLQFPNEEELLDAANMTLVSGNQNYVASSTNTSISTAMVNNEHRLNIAKETKKVLSEVKSIVKTKMFRMVKFILNEGQMAWDNPRFAVQILNKLGVEGDEKRKRVWNNCRQHANLALREKRAAVSAAVKHGVVGKLGRISRVCVVR